MTDWIILGFYLAGYLLTWRRIVFYVARESGGVGGRGPIEDLDLVEGCIAGSIFNLFWPLIWTAVAVRAIYAVRGMSLSAIITPRSVRKQQELVARERRITVMERELGIK